MWNVTEFEFEVGESEKHRVRFYFNQSLGPLKISVDEVVVIRKFLMLSLSTVERYEFPVGVAEKHTVSIEKTRQRMMGGFCPSPTWCRSTAWKRPAIDQPVLIGAFVLRLLSDAAKKSGWIRILRLRELTRG
jgi:hypothetical protein